MQAVGTRRALARRALLAAGALLGSILVAAPARADAVVCHLRGQGTGFQVYRLDLQLGGGQMTMGLTGGAGIYGVVDRSNYYYTEGLMIFSASTGALEAYMLDGITGQRPRILITSGSQTIVDQDAVGPDKAGRGWAWYYNPGGLSAGSHYVVAFGFGGGTFDDFVSLAVLPGTAKCQQVTPSGADLIQYDQTNFRGSGADLRTSGQIYVPGAGGGGNISLSFQTTRRFFVGYILAGGLVGNMRLTYSTPGPKGRIDGGGVVPAVWPPGQANFTASYLGVGLTINIDGWALDLP